MKKLKRAFTIISLSIAALFLNACDFDLSIISDLSCVPIGSLSDSDNRSGSWSIEYKGMPHWNGNLGSKSNGSGSAQDAKRALREVQRLAGPPDKACFYPSGPEEVVVENGTFKVGTAAIAQQKVSEALSKGSVTKDSRWRGQHPVTKQWYYLYFEDNGRPYVRLDSPTSVGRFAQSATVHTTSGILAVKFEGFSLDIYPTSNPKVLRVSYVGRKNALMNFERL